MGHRWSSNRLRASQCAREDEAIRKAYLNKKPPELGEALNKLSGPSHLPHYRVGVGTCRPPFLGGPVAVASSGPSLGHSG
jgi:hypothetical protein